MADYSSFKRRTSAHGHTQGMWAFISSTSLRRPLHFAIALPWLLVMVPVTLLPLQWANALGGAWLTEVMIKLVPMIQPIAAQSANPPWTAVALSCLWAGGPMWTVVTVILCVRSQVAGAYNVPKVGPGLFIFSFMFFSALLLVLAGVRPRPWKTPDSVQMLFSNALGLFSVGWFAITAFFIVLGFLIANPVSRYWAKK